MNKLFLHILISQLEEQTSKKHFNKENQKEFNKKKKLFNIIIFPINLFKSYKK